MTTPDAGQRLIEDLRIFASMECCPEIHHKTVLMAADEIERLRKSLHHYTKDKWAPVADYSDNYWYQSGKAPWKHADAALAASRSTGAADVGEDHG